MLAGSIGAIAETSLDKRAAKIAVHAVIRLAGNVARVPFRIDLHMHMAAPAIVAACPGRKQREVAFDDNAYGLFGIIADFDDGTEIRPDDFQARWIVGLGWAGRQQGNGAGGCDDVKQGYLRYDVIADYMLGIEAQGYNR